MKKFICLLLALVLLSSLSLVGCGEKPADVSADEIRVGLMTGPTGMGMAQLMDAGYDNYKFTKMSAVSDLLPLMLQEKLDIAALPANAAATLFQKSGGKIVSLGVAVTNVLYLLAPDGTDSIAALRGKTVAMLSSGKGATPEATVTYLLSAAGLTPGEDVTIAWFASPELLVAGIKDAENTVAILPEPNATAVLGQLPGYARTLDLADAWRAVTGQEPVTAILAGRRAFLDAHPEAVRTFLSRYASSVAFLEDSPADGAAVIERQIGLSAALVGKALPYCHICWIPDEDGEAAISAYLAILAEKAPTLVGGAAPGTDFYYKDK